MTERTKQYWLRFLQWIVARPLFSFPWLYSIRNWLYTKTLPIGEGIILQENVSITKMHYLNGKLHIGNNVTILRGVTLDYSGGLIIEDNVTVSFDTYVLSHMHDIKNPCKRSGKPIPKQTVVKKGVWVGARCTILGGVTIGEGSVVGAGSIVTKDIPCNQVWAGVPAKMIRKLEDYEIGHRE